MDLGDRMKRYESVSQQFLMGKTPIIIRIDGKAFHTYTKGMQRPFCDIMHNSMVQTAKFLVEQIQGAVFAYTQSDEISILIRDWDDVNTESWFFGKLQKVISVSASLATYKFNDVINNGKMALFDSRAFNLPPHEAINYFIWRQQDASRNSVQMLGHAHFSKYEMHGKNVGNIQDMLMEKYSINWNDCATWQKRGTCVVTKKDESSNSPAIASFAKTIVCIDEEIPIFTQQREYINKYCQQLLSSDESVGGNGERKINER
jgi:tRNA(His) guanylyltransferase